MTMTPSKRSVRVTVLYVLFGTVWIFLSDLYLDWLNLDAAKLSDLQTLKGIAYVLATAVVFYLLVRRELARQIEADLEANRRENTLQALFEATFEHAAVGMAHTALDGRFLRVNLAYCHLVGYSRNELLGMTFRDITHPDDLGADLENQQRMLVGEVSSFTMDKRLLHKDGAVVWVTLTVSMVPDLEGDARHFLAVVNDISDRKMAEDALRASESRFRALVEQSITGIYVFDEHTFRYVNQRLAQMFGYTEAELIDRLGPLDLIAPEDQGTVGTQVERRLSGRVESVHYTARGLRKDGTRIWLELHGSRMELDGRPAVTGTALDITDRVESEQRLRDSEARFRAIYDGVNDAILILDPHTGIFLDANRKAEEMGGYFAEELGRLNIVDISVGDPAQVQAAYKKRIEAVMQGEPQLFEWQVRNRDSRPLWVEVNMRAARLGNSDRILLLARDITERRAAEEKLRLTSQVFTSTREGVVITNVDNRILNVNPAFTEITGYPESEVVGKSPDVLQSGFHDRSFYQAMWQSIEKTNHWQGEVWNRRKSGETYPQWLTISVVRDERGGVVNYVGVFTDVSRLKHSEAEVQRLAHYDPLTNFPNRVLLMSRLEHALELRRRRGNHLALFLCGLDRIKYINDSLGYAVGDELLQTVSRRIRTLLQSGDTLARFGGDEFAILIESDRKPEEIAQLGEAIVGLSDRPVELSTGQNVYAGISVGVGIAPEDGDDATSLVTNANAAMQQAKSEGRRTYRFYKHGMTEAARERLQLESRLRRAIERDEIELYFQPMVDIASGRIIGAEALSRWQDPELGMIPPDRFIPLAEDTGLIMPLGLRALEVACGRAAEWRTAGLGGLKVAVNLSRRQFEHGKLKEEVAAVIEAAALDPECLELEITESMLMEQGDYSMETLRKFREMGIGVSMDDFGTGYSSLAYLKQFAINKVKIDRMFIQDLPDDRDDAEIVSAIIAMAHNLKLKVLAEGVETADQLAFLEAHGCDEYQGYLLSAPVPADEFEALVRRVSPS